MSDAADTIYTYSEARRNLATLLEKALRDGEVRIRGKDSQIFVVLPEPASGSPLDVEGVDIDLSRDEIVEFIQEGRKCG